MPRYVVERTFPDGLRIPGGEGAAPSLAVVERNADEGVLGPLIRQRGPAEDVLHLRRSEPRGDQEDGEAQRPPRRPHHAGPRPRPVLLQLRSEGLGVSDRALTPEPRMTRRWLLQTAGAGGLALLVPDVALARPRARRRRVVEPGGSIVLRWNNALLQGVRDSRIGPLMASLGFDPGDRTSDPRSPTGIGNLVAEALLPFRHRDGANQLGDEPGGRPGIPYSDYTGYAPA